MVYSWNMANSCHTLKETISPKSSTKNATWKLVSGSFAFGKN